MGQGSRICRTYPKTYPCIGGLEHIQHIQHIIDAMEVRNVGLMHAPFRLVQFITLPILCFGQLGPIIGIEDLGLTGKITSSWILHMDWMVSIDT